jgi:hypothetical protein
LQRQELHDSPVIMNKRKSVVFRTLEDEPEDPDSFDFEAERMADDLHACNDDFLINFAQGAATHNGRVKLSQMRVKLAGHNTTHLQCSSNSSFLDSPREEERNPFIGLALENLR